MQNSYSNENYAGFWVRLAAYIIDSIIVAVGLLVVRLAWLIIGAVISGTLLDGNVLFHYSLKDIVLYIFKVMYFILLTWCTGTTIGKRLMNLRVVPADRNEKLSFVDVLYRETVGRFLCGISIWIGYIIIGIDKEKRGFHDMLCDTRVVYEKKVKVYPEYQGPMGTQMPPVQPQEPVWTETPVQPQESVRSQTEIFSEPVQPQMQEYTQPQDSMQQESPQNYVQRNVQMQSQPQPGQAYRAVPDGGYSFVENKIEEHTQEGDL